MKYLKNITPFETINLNDFVVHKGKQISSKSIIDEKDIEIRFFSASRDEIIDKESYEAETIFFCVAGKMKVIYNTDDENLLEAGQMIALESGIDYGIVAIEDSVFYNILINR